MVDARHFRLAEHHNDCGSTCHAAKVGLHGYCRTPVCFCCFSNPGFSVQPACVLCAFHAMPVSCHMSMDAGKIEVVRDDVLQTKRGCSARPPLGGILAAQLSVGVAQACVSH